MLKKQFYGRGIPGVRLSSLTGTFVVVEGGDGSGRSTQTVLLKEYLERMGYPVAEVGLKRSQLVGPEIEQAMKQNVLLPLTLSLFYATDLADQLENSIIPALRAGFIVIADRYIYTLMVRDIVRGADPVWIRGVYGMALVPDVILYLDVNEKVLAERSFQKSGALDYWESGMDIQRSGDMYECFMKYQRSVRKVFSSMVHDYSFEVVNGERDPLVIHQDIQERMKKILKPRRSKSARIKPEVPKIEAQPKVDRSKATKRTKPQKRR